VRTGHARASGCACAQLVSRHSVAVRTRRVTCSCVKAFVVKLCNTKRSRVFSMLLCSAEAQLVSAQAVSRVKVLCRARSTQLWDQHSARSRNTVSRTEPC
jgi:hypothetical protein